MSIFSDLVQLSSMTVDAVMAERLRLVPMLPGVYKAAQSDPYRDPLDVEGVYREWIRRVKVETSNVGRDLNQQILTPAITFSIDRGALGATVFNCADRILRLEQDGSPAFEIVAIEPDGGERLLFSVVRV